MKTFSIFICCFLSFGNLQIIAQVKLKKEMTFNIESVNPIEITDYDQNSEQFLGLGASTNKYEVFLIDKKGEVLAKKNIAGQGPGQISGALNGVGFSPEGGIWVMTLGKLLFYDMKLNFQKQEIFDSKINISRYGNPKPISFISKNSKRDYLFVTYPSGERVFSMTPKIESEYLLELYDSNQRKNLYLAAMNERAVSSKLDNSIKGLYFPIFVFDKVNKRAFVTGSIDGQLSIVDLVSNDIQHVNIRHGEFKSLSLSKITSKDLPSSGPFTLTAINHKIVTLDDGLVLLNYVKEIPEAVFKSKNYKDKYYHHFQDPTYHRLILFDQTKQLSNDIPVPKNAHLMISLPGNKLLFKIVDPEVEMDFVRYDIYQLVVNE